MNEQRHKIETVAHSNIALIKYWGKEKGRDQIPLNPSVSFTLSKCYTTVDASITEKKGDTPTISLQFEGQKHPAFEHKLVRYFQKISEYLPEINHYDVAISSRNSFPHSSGIASSASAFAAFSQLIASMASRTLTPQEISHHARLGSGSACRSTQNGWSLWGAHHHFKEASNLHAIPYPKAIHPNFSRIKDSILIIDSGEKTISSTQGHRLLENHPFTKNRIRCAKENLTRLSEDLESGAWDTFGKMIETEALMLHAMMMSSNPSYILMKPDTLRVIEEVRSLRSAHALSLFFTLDAGANVHLIYPHHDEKKIKPLVEDLGKFCGEKKIIHNEIIT